MAEPPRAVDVHRAVTAYEAVASAYDHGRPSYPADAVAWVIDVAGIGRGSQVLDLAAGTGKLTRQLLVTGATLQAVEPVAAFRERLAELPVAVDEGTAEAIPCAGESVDAVTVAAAFHWFDAHRAVAEIARVLRPGGVLAILWNERDQHDATQRALTALVEPYRRSEPRQSDEAWLEALTGSSAFGPLQKKDFRHTHAFTVATLANRIESVSFIAALPDRERSAVLDEVRALASRRGARFELPHVTHVYAARRRLSDPGRPRGARAASADQ